jgi:hypothetical protein
MQALFFAALGYGSLSPAIQATCMRTVLPQAGRGQQYQLFRIDLAFF